MPSNKRGATSKPTSAASSPAKKGKNSEKNSEGDNNNRASEAEPVIDGGQQQGLTHEQAQRLDNIETIVTGMQTFLKEHLVKCLDRLNKYLNIDMEDEEMNAEGTAGAYILKTSCLVAQLAEDVQNFQTTVVDRLDNVDAGLDFCRDALGDSEHHTEAERRSAKAARRQVSQVRSTAGCSALHFLTTVYIAYHCFASCCFDLQHFVLTCMLHWADTYVSMGHATRAFLSLRSRIFLRCRFSGWRMYTPPRGGCNVFRLCCCALS